MEFFEALDCRRVDRSDGLCGLVTQDARHVRDGNERRRIRRLLAHYEDEARRLGNRLLQLEAASTIDLMAVC